MFEPADKAIAKAVEIFGNNAGIMRTSKALELGIQARTLYSMRDQGLLERLSRGVYHLASLPLPHQPDVAAVMQRIPNAVLCLVSALDFHEIGTQIPAEIQVALPHDTKAPRIDYPRIKGFHMSSASLRAGLEQHDMGGTVINVFGVAKTIADCFKYRGQIGQDIAIEALQEVIRGGRASAADIMRFAAIDRVTNIIRPYLEVLQ